MCSLNDIPAPGKRMRVLNTSTLIDLLLRRAIKDLNSDELRQIAEDGPELANTIARNAASLVEGLGMLITCDSDSWAGETAGSFRGRDELGQLLYHIADVLDTVQAISRASIEVSRVVRRGDAPELPSRA